MTVYADILILLNLLVDYFLLSLTARLIHVSTRFWRLFAAALVGGFSALAVFIPPVPIAAELLFHVALCLLLTLIGFGFCGWRPFLRAAGVFYAVTCGYTGGMIAVWYLARPKGMVICNSVVYFNISPVWLTVFTMVGYVLTLLFQRLFSRHAPTAEFCDVCLYAENSQADFTALLDTGNSVRDPFGTAEVIVADEAVADALFGPERDSLSVSRRYRVLPCSTVGGKELLDGYRCDKAIVTCQKKKTVLNNPILAISKAPFQDGYTAILNPEFLQES